MLLPLLVLWLQAQLSAQPPTSWLDQPLIRWNRTGAAIPTAPAPPEPLKAVISRCRLTPPATVAAGALSDAGWIPFHYLGKPLEQGDVEIVGGMTGADGMCRPTGYNVFVFVAQRFAGTLSRARMTSREDASSGEVTLNPPEIIVEFVRYTANDPLCCPSSRVTVRYRIDRASAGPVVVPIDVRSSG